MKQLLGEKTGLVIEMNEEYPFNITSIRKWVDGKYIEYCYSTGIPGSDLYGQQECFEIYFYKSTKLSDGHYKSFAYGTFQNKQIKDVPTKHKKVLDLLIKKHEELFGVKYTG